MFDISILSSDQVAEYFTGKFDLWPRTVKTNLTMKAESLPILLYNQWSL